MKVNKIICVFCLALFLSIFTPMQVNASGGTTTLTVDVPETHEVMLYLGENGSVSVDGRVYNSSQAITLTRLENYTYTFIPDQGYELSKVVYNGETAEVKNAAYTAPPINQDSSIEVTFRKSAVTAKPDNPLSRDRGDTTKAEAVKTGDQTKLSGTMNLLLVSGIVLIGILILRKRNSSAS